MLRSMCLENFSASRNDARYLKRSSLYFYLKFVIDIVSFTDSKVDSPDYQSLSPRCWPKTSGKGFLNASHRHKELVTLLKPKSHFSRANSVNSTISQHLFRQVFLRRDEQLPFKDGLHRT